VKLFADFDAGVGEECRYVWFRDGRPVISVGGAKVRTESKNKICIVEKILRLQVGVLSGEYTVYIW
jgi:hypothetical protein